MIFAVVSHCLVVVHQAFQTQEEEEIAENKTRKGEEEEREGAELGPGHLLQQPNKMKLAAFRKEVKQQYGFLADTEWPMRKNHK